MLPTKQAKLLSLWDELGLPHSEVKQESGPVLTIIGFIVDVNAMSISIPPNSLNNIISVISEVTVPGNRVCLCNLQHLAGWINWVLNVYPLLQPCLCALYAKMLKKNQHLVYVNTQMCQELCWAVGHLKTAPLVFMLNSLDWELCEADYFLLTDASMSGMGFWSPHHNLGYQASILCTLATPHIIFY